MQKDGTGLIDHDIWLEPYRGALQYRHRLFQGKLREIQRTFGSLEKASLGHHYFYINQGEHKGVKGLWYREWAPGAARLSFVGDFNDWNPLSHPMKKDKNGVWSIFLTGKDQQKLEAGSKIKVHVTTSKGAHDKIPAYATKVITDEIGGFVAYYQKPTEYTWKHDTPEKPKATRIYETHVGIAQEEEKFGTFAEFTENVLPRIQDLGYNTIQIMALAQHPYYGSFGYQVSNFFAVSHYFGKQEDLKKLVDEAHKRGLYVLMDIVHSHFSKNTSEGLNELDGTDFLYSPAGPKGDHPAWDTKLFDYSKAEVLRYLLSNLRYWLEEYNIDGFRFDGVTSMLYHHHGLEKAFDHYDNYFNWQVNIEAVNYLKLANKLIKQVKPGAITIAEDMSGMPGMARPVPEGGLGFDYRLAMGLPDYWIKILKHKNDESWNMDEIYQTLVNRRYGEKHVAYAESHDQALVGDKTIAFRLMDKEMYTNMSTDPQYDSPIIDRGIALHKLIRLMTFSLGGEAWLNFMGNEFGHPEWIDFPREGNGFSHKYARRQWSLVDANYLKYQYLNNFDRALQSLDEDNNILSDEFTEMITTHEANKLLIYRHGPLVFALNLHPDKSYNDLQIGVPDLTDYQIVLNSDLKKFGGFDRVSQDQKFIVDKQGKHGREQSIKIYLPSRVGLVLKPVDS